tara:strand:+ start:4433 stop:4687 length:255 start_codon:yes stop_codon:yes gene_type:complete
MKKIKNIIKLCTLCVVVVCFCFSCQEQQRPKKEIYYVISYGGFFGGRFVTNNYKLKNGYYLFLTGRDSIKLKETLVESIIKKQH